MLNQFAVEIPTLPVDQCHSHERMLRHSVATPNRREEPAKVTAQVGAGARAKDHDCGFGWGDAKSEPPLAAPLGHSIQGSLQI